MSSRLTRRTFTRLATGAAAAAAAGRVPHALSAFDAAVGSHVAPPLTEFDYGDITVESVLHRAQLENSRDVLMSLSEDSLLKPFRQMAGQRAPGDDLGGWYNYDPNFDWHRDDAGFAPGATFGQWVSALARYHAVSGSREVQAKVLRLNRLYAGTIDAGFYDKNRFPAYCYDKLILGLIDSHRLAADGDAPLLLERTTRTALPFLPAAAIDRELPWRPGTDQSFRWDESYTIPENLLLAYRRGVGRQYRDLAVRFLDDVTWFDPLARGENVLADKHAYSYVNSLSSAMQAWLTLGSEKHLRAARNAFDMLSAQSYPTGGWGPDEKLVAPAGDGLYASLTSTHNTFETPCGSYAHFKLTRYLLRVTRDPRYGDSMERVMYNTVLGAKPLRADGRAFYYADYNLSARKVYSNHRFPCCSGTLPQLAADYGISSFLRDARGIYVNLYLPSNARWVQQGARCSLRQITDYPFDDTVAMRLAVSQPGEFAVRLRIPAWASGARIAVNGSRWQGPAEPGSFATIDRGWHDGDRIELELPRRLRIEPLDARHPRTVALLCGPLVLFAVGGGAGRLQPQRAELLRARQIAAQRWEASVGETTLTLLPYVAIDDEEYSTFLTLAA